MSDYRAGAHGTVTLAAYIAALKRIPQGRVLTFGLDYPGSYRGYYDHISFGMADEIRIEDALATAEGALNKTFGGYKGGDFVMGPTTPVWIAEYGHCGWPLSPELLAFILHDDNMREAD